MSADQRVALVTGANRGLGYETCRQLLERGYRVVLTSRDLAQAQVAARRLAADDRLITRQLDVSDEASIVRLSAWLQHSLGRLDVLVNNAALMPAADDSILTVELATVRTVLETNVLGVLRLTQALLPLMRAGGYGRIVNLSSGMGQLGEMHSGDNPAYRMSKVALNSLTRMFAAEAGHANILINAVCPGWVQTDMGGPHAPRSISEGVDTILWLATLPENGPTGGFFQDRRPLDW